MSRCARPSCRTPFEVNVRPGRPRTHCSDECRRAADAEYKQALAVLSHFEGLVEQARADIAAFGRDAADESQED